MNLILTLLLLLGALIVLAVVLGIGVLVLIKMGVITKYAFKKDLPEEGDYDLDQSHQAGEE